MRLRSRCLVALVVMSALVAGVASRAQTTPPRPPRVTPAATVDVPVSEGTSMSVAVSPDGRTLAIDLQGSIWTLPAAGGTATRITDVFNDARQPAWSPDGRTIAFFAYRDGGYDLWAIVARRIEPAQAHRGRLRRSRAGVVARRIAHRVLVRSRQPARQRLQHLGARAGQRRAAPADDAIRPRTRCRAGRPTTPTSRSCRPATASGTCGRCRRKAAPSARWPRRPAASTRPSWGPGGQIVLHALEGRSSRLELGGASITGTENAFPFRPSWASATEFFYTADGKIRRRAVGAASFTDVPFTATLQATPARYTRAARNFDSRDAAQGARRGAPGDLARCHARWRLRRSAISG